ncbi:hypothetical protein KVR01_011349 [Diaporthe batatas]|uniref:uncharacterized protein n=1 Tax=Diaporthe batatas TaxID=748121 RepID=UPI001D048CA8|nr:uncharacterized protein KVR01_011349 [Diaporthe batatas]KAG8158906.1 hypothetical protein KVR01_011349 [Diaporthe batatas]
MTDRYGHPRQTVFGRRHASAAATVSYSDTRQAHPPASSAAQQAQQGAPAHPKSSSNAGVRRNLFQGQLTRRPTTGPGSNSSGEPGAGSRGAGDLDGMEVEEDDSASSDIVVRDKNGEVELYEPPPLVVDDPDEIALDMRQENEKERQRLADAVKHHQNIVNQSSAPAQPEELFEAVRASLRAKVAALSEDNWMYEKEDEPRLV